jgi:hypothetical protein
MTRLLDRVALVVTAVLVLVGLWNAPWDSMAHFSGRYLRVLGDKLDPKGRPGFACRDTDGLISTMDSVAEEILRELDARRDETRTGLAMPMGQSSERPRRKYEERTQRLREAYWALGCARFWRPRQ